MNSILGLYLPTPPSLFVAKHHTIVSPTHKSSYHSLPKPKPNPPSPSSASPFFHQIFHLPRSEGTGVGRHGREVQEDLRRLGAPEVPRGPSGRSARALGAVVHVVRQASEHLGSLGQPVTCDGWRGYPSKHRHGSHGSNWNPDEENGTGEKGEMHRPCFGAPVHI